MIDYNLIESIWLKDLEYNEIKCIKIVSIIL